ncbi:hypothetical protein [Chromohalobacter japonicus]|uniref:hypothetical protein n=1 Tax=Chromohalobacter japonicus TaxID=223900 RepID=UPI001177CEA3|nr:hypothetical protein [Chromohalobacter japonicus]MCK0752432.1 hypothetical protein [Chromohalobacter japonicus]
MANAEPRCPWYAGKVWRPSDGPVRRESGSFDNVYNIIDTRDIVMISLYFKRAHVTKVASRASLERGTPVLCKNLGALA